jgi:hypothetical protein
MNHVLIIENALSEEYCDAIIEKSIPLLKEDNDRHPWNFKYHYLKYDDILTKVMNDVLQSYITLYPEIDKTPDRWTMSDIVFKQFDPGKFYDGWHSEQSFKYSTRLLCVIFYLSDHNCGTEFYNGEVVLSKKGRALIFPTSWTHTHRGQQCLDNKKRYIMNSYAIFVNDE